MKIEFANKDNKSQYNWMFQLKSDKLVPFSAQKLIKCLAAVDEEAQKALENFTACCVKFQSLQDPIWGLSLWF